MLVKSVVSGSAFAEADLLAAAALTAVILAVLLAAGVAVVVSVDSVDACSLAVPVVSVVVSVVESADVVVALLDARADFASARCSELALEAVDDAVVFFGAVEDDLLVLSAALADEVADPVVDLGPRAVWPVVFFADAEPEVAEPAESDEELWSVSSALATATIGLARDNPSAKAAIPALAPR